MRFSRSLEDSERRSRTRFRKSPDPALGFRELWQTASHIILRLEHPVAYTVSVPAYKQLRPGTLRDLVTSVAEKKGVSATELLQGLQASTVSLFITFSVVYSWMCSAASK